MAYARLAVLMLLACSVGLPRSASAAVLHGVRFGKHGAVSRVVFDLQQQVPYRLETTADPLTIRVVFPGLSLAPKLDVVQVSDALIREVQFRATATAVIGDIVLKQSGTIQQQFQLGTPPRVVLEIGQQQALGSTPRKARQPGRDSKREAARPPAKEPRPMPPQPQPSPTVAASRTTGESTASVPPAPPPAAARPTPQPVSVPPVALTPEQLLERAEQQWAARQLEAAQRAYTTFLQRYPEHPHNHFIAVRLADILRAQGHHREALEAYTAVLQGYAGKDGALISQIRLAELGATMPELLPPGNEPRYAAYRQPLAALQRLIQEYPFNPLADVAQFKIGEIRARQHDRVAALEIFQHLLRRPLQEALRRDVEASLRQTLGQLLADYQQQRAFLKTLQTFFAYQPFLSPEEVTRPDLLAPVVMSYAQLGLLDEALSLLPTLRKATALPAPMVLTLATLCAQGASPEMVGTLVSPVTQFDDPALQRQALLLLMHTAERTHRPDELERALGVMADLLTTAAERARFWTILGQTYTAQGRPAQALRAFHTCAEVSEAGDMAETCLLRAAALHMAQGDQQAALARYQRVLQLFPTSRRSSGLLFRLAESYRQQTDAAQMQATLLRLRESTPEPFWQKVATASLEQLQWQERLHERLAVFQNSLMR